MVDIQGKRVERGVQKMKYIKQFLIIMIISVIGEVMKFLIPLPVPASIYGLMFMLAALLTGIIKLEDVREAGHFLVELMPPMFIPVSVGLIVSWNVLKEILAPVVIITVVSTVAVMGIAGIVTQAVIRRGKKENNE